MFKKSIIKKNSGIQSVCQTELDPDQARHIVGPDLGSNCLQRLSAFYFSRQRVNILLIYEIL